jgi:uncharacterized protein YcbX
MRIAGSVASVHVYPVKSCRGIDVGEWPLDEAGLRHDRRFMIIHPDGRFVTQRELPELARVATRLGEDAVELSSDGHGAISVPLEGDGPTLSVDVWRDHAVGTTVDPAIDAWLSRYADRPLRLLRFDDRHRRRLDVRYAPDHTTRFADGYPVLVLSQASLDALNARLALPVPMDRFRPNLVVDGTAPFAEDAWRDFSVGDATLRNVKPCARCVITTTDQQTGERGAEPLRTLASFRRDGNEVMFGQNAVVTRPAVIRVGDRITV